MARVLAIGAHPDDPEHGCAGSLLHHAERHVLVMSRGERGGPPVARLAEAEAAAAVLGARLRVLAHPDTRMAAVDLAPDIEAALRETAPDLVLIMSSADTHQDHRAVHEATVIAVRGHPCTVLAYVTPSAAERFRPTWFVPLTEEQMAVKLRALACHASQSHRAYLAPEYIVGMARYWAMVTRSTAPYVEPFELVRHLEAP